MNIPTVKEKFLGSIDTWLKERIDDMVSDNPVLTLPSVYIKRGCHNILNKYKGKISEGIDNAALFFADEEGNINIDSLFKDAMELFGTMEKTSFDMGILKGFIGEGKVAITLPDNIFMNIIFGSKKTLTFGEEDFMELKTLLLTE